MKGLLMQGRRKFKNVMVYFDASYKGDGGGCRLVNIKTGEFVTHSAFTDEFLRLYRHKWSITMLVAHKAPHDTKCKLSDLHVDIKQEILQSDIANFLNDEHQTLHKSINEKYVSNLMWLGSPIGQVVEDEKQMYQLVENLGGLDAKAKWES